MRYVLCLFLLLAAAACSPEPTPAANSDKLTADRPKLFGNGARPATEPEPSKPESDAQPTDTPPTVRLGASLASDITLVPTGRWTDLKARTPLLELKRDPKGAWAWYHGDKTLDPTSSEMGKALSRVARYKHHGTGWQGDDADGASRNTFVLHVDAAAPSNLVIDLMREAKNAFVWNVAVGLRGLAEAPRDTTRCVAAESLGTEYVVYTLPLSMGLNTAPTVPKEEVQCIVQRNADSGEFHYSIWCGSRGSRPVTGVQGTLDDCKIGPGATELEGLKSRQFRSGATSKIAEAMNAAVAASPSKIERLAITPRHGGLADRQPLPWLAVDVAWRACLEVQRKMHQSGETMVRILHDWEFGIPPPPEQPPEMEVEFPRDEPERENPTEDERITGD